MQRSFLLEGNLPTDRFELRHTTNTHCTHVTGTICAYHGAITFLTFNIKENQLICSAGVALSNYWEQPPNQIDVSFQSVSMTFNSLTNSVKARPSWIFSSSSLDYRLEWELKHVIHSYPYNDGYMYIWWEYVSVTFPPLFIMTYSHLVGIWRVGICWVTIWIGNMSSHFIEQHQIQLHKFSVLNLGNAMCMKFEANY